MQPRLTFIHGFMGHPSDWDEVRDLIPDSEALAIEVGVSESWQSTLKLLADAMPQESIVVGYSMGARLALGLALELPQKCAGMVFVSGNPGLESEEDRELRWQADQGIASRIESESIDSFLQSWYENPVFLTVPEDIRIDEIQRKQNRSPESWPGILRANSIARQPNYWGQLTELSIPTLVVAGENDEKYRRIAVRFAEECSHRDVETRIVSRCGHMVHRERPDELAKLIHRFQTRVKTLGRSADTDDRSSL